MTSSVTDQSYQSDRLRFTADRQAGRQTGGRSQIRRGGSEIAVPDRGERQEAGAPSELFSAGGEKFSISEGVSLGEELQMCRVSL